MAPTNRLIEARRAELRAEAEAGKRRVQIEPAGARQGAKTDRRSSAKPKAGMKTRAS